MKSRFRLAVGVVALTFVLAIALGATGVLAPKNQRQALGASTTITVLSGVVLVRHGTGAFGPVDDGSVLGPTDTVRTGEGARAVLTYFEGSTVEIEPNSELAIDQAHANPDGSTIIEMTQGLGVTWNVVTHLVSGNSKYEIHTTAATASVRGTAFTIGVDADGTTTETTTDGVVANSDPQGTTTVLAPPGLQVSTNKGEKPAPPVKAPEPERKVIVTIGDQDALVVDSLGRANGFKDGKPVRQTPGAQLAIVDGHLVITLPNVPDGVLATHVRGAAGTDTDVTTRVEERGKSPVEVTEKVKAGENTGVDLKKGTGDRPSVELKKNDKGAPSPKIGEVPPPPTEAPEKTADANKDDTHASGGGGPAVTPPGQLLTPPGQQRTPPANPSAPGQKKTPPGQSQTPPGQGSSPPEGFLPRIDVPQPLTTNVPRAGSGTGGGTSGNNGNSDRTAEPRTAEPHPARPTK